MSQVSLRRSDLAAPLLLGAAAMDSSSPGTDVRSVQAIPLENTLAYMVTTGCTSRDEANTNLRASGGSVGRAAALWHADTQTQAPVQHDARTLGAVIDALVGRSGGGGGGGGERELTLEDGRPLRRHVDRGPWRGGLAFAVRLFGDGFTLAAAADGARPPRGGDASPPPPAAGATFPAASSRKRPRPGGAVVGLADLDAPARYPELHPYDAHLSFLEDIRDGLVPAALQLVAADGADVPVTISVEDFLPRAYPDYVAAVAAAAAPPPPRLGATTAPLRDDDAPPAPGAPRFDLSPASLRSKRLQRFAA